MFCYRAHAISSPPKFWMRVKEYYEPGHLEIEELRRNAELFIRARYVYRNTIGDCPNNTAKLVGEWIAFVERSPPVPGLYGPTSNDNLSRPLVEQETSPSVNVPSVPEHVAPKEATSKRARNESETSSPVDRKKKGRMADNDSAQSQSPEAPIMQSIKDDYDNLSPTMAKSLRLWAQNMPIPTPNSFVMLKTLRGDIATQTARIDELENHRRWDESFIRGQAECQR
ncbi:hypothetical protein B0I37DRAFT_374354 [Chaetomium sp. MPI-CAGE-AT-0009]|nr:hypothetical protein B0I37DRAFT_374354 [Chaetomium sp. MPI-CAGE-AT-0009]